MVQKTHSKAAYKTFDEAVAVARELAPTLRDRVPQAEELRRLPDENVADLLDSGLVHLETPKMFGGPELNLDALLEVTGALAEGCSSTGWVYALWGAHIWLIGQYPEHIQEMVFDGSNSLVSSVVNVEGNPVPVDGGYRFTGRGFFSSGVDHCNWMTAALNLKPDEFPGDTRWFLMPRADIEIVDDWFAVGLKGTGSKTVVFNDVFIPEERVISFRELSEGKGVGASLHNSTLYRASFDFTFSVCLGGPVVGIARSLLNAYTGRMRERLASGNPRQVGGQQAGFTRLAQASAQIEAARALLLSTARQFCTIPASEASPLDRAQCRRDTAFAAQLCREAANKVFEASGASNIFESRDIQRLWRDSNVAAAHASLGWDSAAHMYSRVALGLPAFDVPGEQSAPQGKITTEGV
jgi:alkylation response protein AidB-like acyl-CoA dehydrogenase